MRTKSIVLCLVGLLLLLASSANAEIRTWTKTDGTKIEAEFVSWEQGKAVVLRQADGKDIKVGFHKLSPDDRKYVKQQVNSPKKQETKPGGEQKPVRPACPFPKRRDAEMDSEERSGV